MTKLGSGFRGTRLARRSRLRLHGPDWEERGEPEAGATIAFSSVVGSAALRGPDGQTFVDAQTLRDLDVFPREPGAPSLFDQLDHTRTTGGRKELVTFLTSGTIDSAVVTRRQAAIRFFASQDARDGWRVRSSARSLDHVERYLVSYVPPLSGARGPFYWVRALWYRGSYAPYFEHLDAGLRALHRVARALEEMGTAPEDPSTTALPEELGRCRAAIEAFLDDPTIAAFRRAGGAASRFRPAEVLHYDERIRRECAPLVRAALDAVYRIDLFASLGTVAGERALVFPEVVAPGAARDRARIDSIGSDGPRGNIGPDLPELDCAGLAHPLISSPVRNDVRLGVEEGFLFLTGPNMAGKTTLMKALGLAVYMAHLGLPVACRSMRLSLFDGLRSCLSVEDDLGRGYSFFYAEVRRVKLVAEQLRAGRRLVVLFDELFRGTNLKDALDGSRLVVDGFRRFPRCLFILSSHLVELGEELATEGTHPNRIPLGFRRFEVDVDGPQLRFSYQLRPGISAERLGMRILESEGIPELLHVSPQPRDPEPR